MILSAISQRHFYSYFILSYYLRYLFMYLLFLDETESINIIYKFDLCNNLSFILLSVTTRNGK